MSLSVAEHIQSRLSRSESLKEKVGDRMFPVALSSETSFPFVCYERASVVPGRTRFGLRSVTWLMPWRPIRIMFTCNN